MFLSSKKLQIPAPKDALPGRDQAMAVAPTHAVSGNPMEGPFPDHELALFGMGCFWGAERVFWRAEGVYTTAVGYAAGFTPNPTYEEVCSGRTGHNEVVRVVFDPAQLSHEQLLALFWEHHNPTQGMRQGNDRGTQYRSGIYCYSDQALAEAQASRVSYQAALTAAGHPPITTEITRASAFYFAEDYHQQYLHKNPNGYCGLGGTGVSCPVGTGV